MYLFIIIYNKGLVKANKFSYAEQEKKKTIFLITMKNNTTAVKKGMCSHNYCLHTFFTSLKVALQIFRRKFYKNTKKSSLYSQALYSHSLNSSSRKPFDKKRN